ASDSPIRIELELGLNGKDAKTAKGKWRWTIPSIRATPGRRTSDRRRQPAGSHQRFYPPPLRVLCVFAVQSEFDDGFVTSVPGDLDPPAALGGFEHGVQDKLCLQRVAEVRARGVPGFHALQEVREGVDEGVLVADRAAGHPPVLHVRV